MPIYIICVLVLICCFIPINENDEKGKEGKEIETTQISVSTTELTEAVTEHELIEFTATAYCPCEKCCGKWARQRKGAPKGCKGDLLESGKSIAVDFNVIPYGSTVVIDGKEYKAVDCGGKIKGNRIDFYFEKHEDAVNFGKQTVYGYIKEEK